MITPINDTDYTGGGNTYQQQQIDKNALRSFGGKYNSLPTYSDGAICRWSNVVVTATSNEGLNNSGWTEAADVSDGVIPTTVNAVALEYVSTLGTVLSVTLNILISSEHRDFMILNVGEGYCLPIADGLPISKIRIRASAYENGVHEATVNVLLVGV